jgi:hypothetical protein
MPRGLAWLPLILALLAVLASAAPQQVLVVRVSGDPGAANATLHLSFSAGNATWAESCTLAGGVCEVPVGAEAPTVVGARFEGGYAAVRVRGAGEASWSGDFWQGFWRPELQVSLVLTDRGVEARFRVQPDRVGGRLSLEIEARKVCVIAINTSTGIEGVDVFFPSRWRFAAREVNETLYVVVPQGAQLQLGVSVSESTELGRLLARIVSYGAAQRPGGLWRGLVVTCPVACGDPNASLAYFLARGVRLALESYLAGERSLASRIGYDVSAYLEDAEFALVALRESESALARGDAEVGRALLERGLAKAASALDSLNQAKADSVPSLLFLLVFTLFLSLIVGNLAERRRGLVATAVFAGLALAELALIPYARMAFVYLDPATLRRASPSSLTLALVTAALGLAIVAAFALGAKGTALSDFFWYSVKSMRRRRLRALLTIATVAVVTAVSGAFLALGSSTVVREEVYPSGFRGLSVSRHLTTTMYIFRGLDQANEYIVAESYAPLSQGEVEWLSKAGWVQRVYLVLVGRAVVERNGSRALALVVATNATKLGGALVSASLAERLGVGVGSAVSVAGRRVAVAGVFNSTSDVKLLDGSPLAEIPPANPPLQGVLVVPVELAPRGAQVYKVLLEGDPPKGWRDSLVRMSYTWSGNMTTSGGAQVTTYVYESYRVCEAGGGSSSCLVVVGEFVQASGVPEFAVVLLLSSMVVAISLLGSMHERGREYSTVSALGASPAYVSAIVLVEGLSYGILGGVAGYVLGQFLQALVPAKAVAVKPSAFSPMLATIVVAIVPSFLGSLIPAREAALRVVPSRLMLRKQAEVRVYEDMAEASIPLRITGDSEEFAEYVKSLVNRPPPVGWGPIYMRVDVRRRDGRVELIEALVSFRSERAAMFLAKIYVPRGPGETVRVVAASPTGEWTIDHKACAKDFLTALRDDLLRYVEWKKERAKRAAAKA